MDTLHQPPDIPPGPQAATPYFLRRQAAVLEVIEEVRPWYAGGLPPGPLAA